MSVYVVMKHWHTAAARYDGVEFTDITTNLDSSLREKHTESHVSYGWAKENVVGIGTVADLLREGFIKWPETPGKSLSDRFFSAVTSKGRAETKEKEQYGEQLRQVTDQYGGTPFPQPKPPRLGRF
jgi:hypothetical protein